MTIRSLIAAIALTVMLLAGASWWLRTRGPAIARGLWGTEHCCDVESAFDQRLRREFPAGSSEERIRATLDRQGFEFPERRRAVAIWSDFACRYTADVTWDADLAGRVISISGDWDVVCL